MRPGGGIALLILTSLALVLLLPSAAPASSDEGRVLVAVSLEPLGDIVSEATGGRVDIFVIVPEGAEPHTYQATPEVIEAVRSAALVVTVAHLPVEEQVAEVTDAPVIGMEDYQRHGLRLIPVPGQGGENIHGFWLDPDNALAIGEAVVEALQKIDPGGAREYGESLSQFRARVEGLKETINAFSSSRGLRAQKVIVSVPAEAYVVSTLGMIPVDTIGRGPGAVIGAGELDQLGRAVERREVRFVTVSEVSEGLKPGQMAIQLAEEHGATILRVRVLSSGLSSYEALWAWNLGSIDSSLKARPGEGGGWSLATCVVAASAVAILGLAVALWKVA